MKQKLKELLSDFRKNEKSIMAFNLQNSYQLEAARLVSKKLETPLIVQFSERYLRFLDEKYGMEYIVKQFSNNFTYFHLDHCIDLDYIKYCVDLGFDSVMYDGSAFNLNLNIENSKIIKDYASKKGCLVEGELGKVSGVEDGFGDEGSSYAEIAEIQKYVNETEIDLMALGIGNAHGFYSDLDGLKLDILREASLNLSNDQLFVLHGGTGLPDKVIREAIGYGVVKINVSTQLKKNTMDILNLYLSKNELYNEISFSNMMIEGLSSVFEDYLIKYTK
ncbi:class II fructose-bisphosphate aldolase [Winogradskyella ursingii]|uniref:class II fructose-bisphosphate aldolase n=1 Tax=Winogradskyella ursingii TaxID=2686079 RepID=UPI0015CB2D69|nr:class II fructose-bisphosphate aldolase [Winogradskyella ursingii]